MIKLQAIGHLGKDCTMNTVNGKNVINFSIAHTEKFKDNTGTQKEKTVWVECAYWTDKTGIAPYLKKGTQVFVDGTPDIRTYQTNDGRQGASLSLRVNSVQLLGGKGSAESQPEQQNYQPQNNSYGNSKTAEPAHQTDIPEPADDLPF